LHTKQSVPATFFPIALPKVKLGQKLDSVVLKTLYEMEFQLHRDDILCVASKVVSISERRIARLRQKRVSSVARALAEKYSMNRQLAQIVLEEADAICGGVKGFLLTIKQGILTPNAGVDAKNSPTGTVALWPVHPDSSAARLRASVMRTENVRLGVMIIDSRITPLRLGTVGIAIGVSGFRAVRDDRGKRDLYGRRVMVTRSNLADDVASAAHLLMGECDERTGLVVVRNAPVKMTWSDPGKLSLGVRNCLIGANLLLGSAGSNT